MSEARRKLLIISYYFAPVQMVASIRWSKFAKYMTAAGWDVTVLTTSSFGDADPLLAAELAEKGRLGEVIFIDHSGILAPTEAQKRRVESVLFGVDISKSEAVKSTQNKPAADGFKAGLKKSILNSRLFKLYSSKRFERRNNMRTVDFAEQAEKYIIEHGGLADYDAVISTYGPETDVLLAQRLKKRFPEVPLIMDFRDPMTSVNMSRKLNRRNARAQKNICAVADEIVAVSDGYADRIPHADGSPAKVIYNGCDPADLTGLRVHPDGRFSFCFTGDLYNGRRDLSALFKALSRAVANGEIERGDISVKYAGNNAASLLRQAAAFDMEDVIEDNGTLPRTGSLELQLSSRMLLLPSWNTPEEKGVLSGKFHEYMMMGRPIVACMCGSVPDSETKRIIERAGLGFTHEQARADVDDDALYEYLVAQYRAYKNGDPAVFEPDAAYISTFYHENLAKRYMALIDEVCGRR